MSEPDFKRQSQGPALLCGPAKDSPTQLCRVLSHPRVVSVHGAAVRSHGFVSELALTSQVQKSFPSLAF